MDAFITQAIEMMVSYVVIILVLLISLNWLTKNFMWCFIKVRASRGAKILMHIHSVDDVYYAIGKWDGTMLTWKDRNKADCRDASIKRECIYLSAGVKSIDYDEVHAGVWTREGAYIPGNDPREADVMYQRILKNPTEDSTMMKLVIFALILLALFACASLFFNYTIYQWITTNGATLLHPAAVVVG